MKTLSTTQLTILGLVAALSVSAPFAQASQNEVSPVLEAAESGDDAKLSVFNYENFSPSPHKSQASVTEIGADLGSGISEELTAESHSEINRFFSQRGLNKIPSSAVALRYLDTGDVVALDETGTVLETYEGISIAVSEVTDIEDSAGKYMTRGVLHPEVKRIIGACLGIGGAGGVLMEDIVQQFNSPAKAAKFVVRRLGLFGAISCAGGVIWEYV